MNERTKDFIFYGIMFAYLVLSIMFIAKEAKATPPYNVQITDHDKAIIKRTHFRLRYVPKKKFPVIKQVIQ